jgi:subfamily B ATP-binding cassette protein MsbA
MKRFWPYFKLLKPVRFHFMGGLLFGVINGAANGFGLPYATQKVLPELFSEVQPSTWTLLTYLSILPAAFFVRGISGFLNTYLMTYCGIRVLRSLQTDVYTKIQHLPLTDFHGWRTGDMMARVLGDTSRLQAVLTSTANSLLRQPVTFIAAISYLVYLSIIYNELVFVLVCLALIPAMVGPVRFTGRKLLYRARQMQAQAGNVSACLQENMLAVKEVRLFNLQKAQISKFHGMLKVAQKLQMKVVKYSNMLGPSVEFMSTIGLSIAIFFAVRSGVTLEQIVPLIIALYMSYQPLRNFGALHNQLKSGLASVERVEEILDRADALPDPDEPVALTRAQGAVEFRGVQFSYGGPDVLHDVDERIAPGEIVALVGPSGAGKTTFANLIPRLYQAQTGQVLVDGVPVQNYLKNDLRQQIAIVPQDPMLFNDTVRNNILIGRPDATEEQLLFASKQAYADEFIGELEQGWETLVGDRGIRLSGGQKQRIAIARAFLKDAPVLILDEATSSLDSESEAMIQKALARLVEGRTTLIIAHRFSTLKIAHRVMVFEAGRIIATGTHDDLFSRNERYRSLYEHQL